MRINPQSFFNFCANHAPLLSTLAARGGDFSEAEAMRLIRANPGIGEELPETAWRRLRELQILIPTEPGSEVFFVAEPVARLLNYLFNEANPATPEIICGYVASLETVNKQLAGALDDEDVQRISSAFDETERLLHRAREEALFNDHPALARNLRFLRLVGAHALRVFTQCRKEIQPLYESLRRSSFIAQGAARALEQLQAVGLSRWGNEHLIGVAAWRYQNVPSDAAILVTLRRVIEFPPELPPVLELTAEEEAPDALVRLLWLESLPTRVSENLPVQDLVDWLAENCSGRGISDVLAAFSVLVFYPDFHATFTDREPRTYDIAGGEITASPVTLTST